MNCNRVREMLFLVVDEQEGSEVLISVREHLERCPGCARRFEYTRRVIGLLRHRCSRAAAPLHLRQRILARLYEEEVGQGPAT